MRRLPCPSLKNFASRQLLAVALLAMVMHALADGGLARAATGGRGAGGAGGFVAEICTSHGLFKPAAPANESAPGPTSSTGHECCALCAAGGSPLVYDPALAVPPVPTFFLRAPLVSANRPALTVAAGHRPRGPPPV